VRSSIIKNKTTLGMEAFSNLIIIPYFLLENVTKSVTNCQISVTFGSDGVFFPLALKSCSTDG